MSTKIYNAYRLKADKDIWDFVEEVRKRANANIEKGIFDLIVGICKDDRIPEPEMPAEYAAIEAEREKLSDELSTASQPRVSHIHVARAHLRRELEQKWPKIFWAKFGIQRAKRVREFLIEKKVRLQNSEEKLQPMDAFDYLSLQYREQANKELRDPFNLNTSLQVFEHKGHFYIRVFSDWTALGDFLKFIQDGEMADWIEDYHYQNQTDRPEGITKSEWKRREKVWEEIYCGPGYTAGPRNMIIDIMSYDGFWHWNPSFELAEKYNGREGWEAFLATQ